MKEFIVKHPFVTFAMVFLVCDTVFNCVKVIKNPNCADHCGIKINFNKKGDEKGV